MKTAPQLEPTPLNDSEATRHIRENGAPVTDFAYQQPAVVKTTATAVVAPRVLPELTTFRALSRPVFGAEAAREYIKEAVVFGSIMVAAAWPLSVTLNQLGTMMISPPPWGPW
jgi:hypothetical protein